MIGNFKDIVDLSMKKYLMGIFVSDQDYMTSGFQHLWKIKEGSELSGN